jgi:GTP cyclohydrolase II
MQVIDPCRAVYVLRMARSRCHPAVEGLTKLTDDNKIVDRSAPEGSKQISPGLREGMLPSAKLLDKVLPRVGSCDLSGGVAQLHGGDQTRGLADYQRYYRSLDPKNPSDFYWNDPGLSVFYQRVQKNKVPGMSAVPASAVSALFGAREHLDVSRVLSELQARRPICVNAPGERLLALPVEGLDDQRFHEFAALCSPALPRLIVTQQRARAIGIETSTAMALSLSHGSGASGICELATGNKPDFASEATTASYAAQAAIRLVKLVRGLPAILTANVATMEGELARSISAVDADAVHRFAATATGTLTVASEASIPLASGASARFVVFRDTLGVDQVAIVVGNPSSSDPIPVRLHSACLTGDVFGSRRCDCGDQLQLAIGRLEALGGGVILYLAQEGRGIGLANKMRAYRLQDQGLDTRDANTTLGFEDDERDYGIAALMLRALDYTRIVLLTNNPAKLEGLTKAGIEIASRIPLEAPVTPHNKRYLTAKALRSGHKLIALKTSSVETT